MFRLDVENSNETKIPNHIRWKEKPYCRTKSKNKKSQRTKNRNKKIQELKIKVLNNLETKEIVYPK